MTDYGKQLSSVAPKPVEIVGENIYINSDIQPFDEILEGRHMTGYEFNCVKYTKDEYIILLASKNAQLEQDLIDTQVALCDLYEAIEGGYSD